MVDARMGVLNTLIHLVVALYLRYHQISSTDPYLACDVQYCTFTTELFAAAPHAKTDLSSYSVRLISV